MTASVRFWMVSAVSLCLCLLGLALGQWQLGRAAQKIALRDGIAARQAMPELDQATFLTTTGDNRLYRSVRLSGQWLTEASIFLDNRPMNGRVGFVVVTPLKLQPSDQVVLVQRGWVPRNFVDRTALPMLDTPTSQVEIRGMVAPPPSRHFALGAGDIGRIRQNLDPASYGEALGVAILPVSVQQSGHDQDGLSRDWPQPDFGIDTHYGYAFQWFTLSGLVALYYLWFQIVKRYRRPQV